MTLVKGYKRIYAGHFGFSQLNLNKSDCVTGPPQCPVLVLPNIEAAKPMMVHFTLLS